MLKMRLLKHNMSINAKLPLPKSSKRKNVENTFGHFLLSHGFIVRSQLLKALQMQDQHPGVKIGECLAALNFIPYSRIVTLLKLMKSSG